jgi:L-malate glycosyltransferase
MKILCILKYLTLPDKGVLKEGLYPTLVRMHVEGVASDIPVLADNTRYLDTQDISKASKAMGGASVVFVTGVSVDSVMRYAFLSIGTDVRKFLSLIYRYRYELSAMDKYVKEHGPPNIITALHSCEDSGLLAYLIGRRHGIPYIVMEHKTEYQRGLIKGGRRRIIRRVVRSAKLLLTVSPQLGESIKKTLDLEGAHFKTMPNPIPDSFFEEPSVALHSQVNKFMKGKFVFAGWTKWRDIKRLDIALQAFKKVKIALPDSCLIIAGPVPDWAPKMAVDLGIKDAVLFTGSLNREEIKRLAYRCDCCVLTSDHETFGLPVIESLAAGKPVVATRCGGPESIIVDNKYGQLVEKGNLEEFAKAMLQVVKNYTTFDPEVLRSYCRANYSEKILSQKWKEIYKSLPYTSGATYRLPSYQALRLLLMHRNQYRSDLMRKVRSYFKRFGARRLYNGAVGYILEFYELLRKKEIEAAHANEMYDILDTIHAYLPSAPSAILDIGAGLGGIDLTLYHYFKSYPTLYLLDKDGLLLGRHGGYHGYVEDFSHYNSFQWTRRFLEVNGVPAEKINTIDITTSSFPTEKFDLVISLLSWGFHFPVDTYIQDVHKQLKKGGRLILDIRKGTDGVDVLREVFNTAPTVLYDGGKFIRVGIEKQ